MSDQCERITYLSQPSGEIRARVGQLLADPPHGTLRAMARSRMAPERLVRPEERMDIQSIVRRLLAADDPIKDTLTRVCEALREVGGWSDVRFRPADRHARALPSVQVTNASSQPGTAHHLSARPTPLNLVASARGSFVFAVQGASDLLGVIECRDAQRDTPDAALLGIVASLGPAIGQFIERLCAPARRRASAAKRRLGATSARAEIRLDRAFEAMETVADSVLIFDRKGRILHTNAAARAVLGHASGRLSTLARRARLLAPRDERDHPLVVEQLPISRILRGETLTDRLAVEIIIRGPDGHDHRLSATGAPIYDDLDVLIGGIAILQDVTDRWRRERTLQDANLRMREFLAIAAHELRTPITGSKGYVQLAAKRVTQLAADALTRHPALVDEIEDTRKHLDDAERSTTRLALLVERLLDVARIQTDKLELLPEAANLADIVRTAVQEQRLATPARAIRCRLSPTRTVHTLADPMRIGQVLMNYLANAIKYSPDDSAIAVTLDVRDTEAHVRVHDEGPGIPHAKQKRIWSRFDQLDSVSQLGASGGLGLGLYISKAIVEAHGGHVGVRSVAGRGATFWFSLPLARLAE